jgi:hypothetical protein
LLGRQIGESFPMFLVVEIWRASIERDREKTVI